MVIQPTYYLSERAGVSETKDCISFMGFYTYEDYLEGSHEKWKKVDVPKTIVNYAIYKLIIGYTKLDHVNRRMQFHTPDETWKFIVANCGSCQKRWLQFLYSKDFMEKV